MEEGEVKEGRSERGGGVRGEGVREGRMREGRDKRGRMKDRGEQRREVREGEGCAIYFAMPSKHFLR